MYDASTIDTTGGWCYAGNMPSKIVSESTRQAMVAAYYAGATMKEAAAPFGLSWMACRFALRRADAQPRSRSEAHRKYKLDEGVFVSIDTEQKAYWLGFLLADGTLTTNGAGTPVGCTISLAAADVDHLVKWKAACRSDHPIVFRSVVVAGVSYKTATVSIYSQRMASALVGYGVVPAKSLIARPCNVDGPLQRHYWRGVLDGDGFIGRAGGKWTLGLVGTRAVVAGFQSFLLSHGLRLRGRVRPHQNIWTFRISGMALPQEVGHLLWNGATVYLDRKHRRYVEMQQDPIQRRYRGDLTRESLLQTYAEAGSWNAVAHRLMTSRGRLHYIRKRLGA